VLLVEGIHGLNERLTQAVSANHKFRVYVSALTQLTVDNSERIFTSDSRLLRRIVRDRLFRGYRAERSIEMWPSVRRGEQQHIFPFQEQADAIFNSALVYEPAVLKTYAERFLLEVPTDSPSFVEADRLLRFLSLFVPIFSEEVPHSSILREFIGGSSFPLLRVQGAIRMNRRSTVDGRRSAVGSPGFDRTLGLHAGGSLDEAGDHSGGQPGRRRYPMNRSSLVLVVVAAALVGLVLLVKAGDAPSPPAPDAAIGAPLSPNPGAAAVPAGPGQIRGRTAPGALVRAFPAWSAPAPDPEEEACPCDGECGRASAACTCEAVRARAEALLESTGAPPSRWPTAAAGEGRQLRADRARSRDLGRRLGGGRRGPRPPRGRERGRGRRRGERRAGPDAQRPGRLAGGPGRGGLGPGLVRGARPDLPGRCGRHGARDGGTRPCRHGLAAARLLGGP
jgi:hypothetical protein